MKKVLLVLAFLPAVAFSQTRKQRKLIEAQQRADAQVINNLKNHFSHLYNLQHGNTASAAEYIAAQFKLTGLSPKGSEGFYQHLQINKGKQIDPATSLKINGTLLALHKDYFPLSYSASKSVNGMPAMALKERGVPWFTDIKEWLADNDKSAIADVNALAQKEAARAAAKGATALFIYNSSSLQDDLYFNPKDKTNTSAIPVVYIKKEGYKKYLQDNSQMLDIELNVALKEANYNTNNIIGYVNNGASATVAIGSYYNSGKNENRADTVQRTSEDYAVGSAMLIELAKAVFSSKSKNNNYLFVAFDDKNAENESSTYFPKVSPAISPVDLMINVSRAVMYNEEKKLFVQSSDDSGFVSPQVIPTLADKPLEVSFAAKSIEADDAAPGKKYPVVTFIKDSSESLNSTSATVNFERELQITKFVTRFIDAASTKGVSQAKTTLK